MKKLIFLLLLIPILSFAQHEKGKIPLRQIDSIDTLNIKKVQWEAYLDRLTGAQTLSFSSPDLTISGGNTVDLSALSTTTFWNRFVAGFLTPKTTSDEVIIGTTTDAGAYDLQVASNSLLGGTTYMTTAQLTSTLNLFESSSVGTPPSGYGRFRAGTDGLIYYKNDAGTEYDLTASGGGGAPTDATYLTTTSNATLTNEVVVGTTPSGDLGGTWSNISVDNDSHSHTGSTISGLSVSDLTSVTGTPSSSTYLRGDNTWATPPSAVWSTDANGIYYNGGDVALGTGITGSSSSYDLRVGTGGLLSDGKAVINGEVQADYLWGTEENGSAPTSVAIGGIFWVGTDNTPYFTSDTGSGSNTYSLISDSTYPVRTVTSSALVTLSDYTIFANGSGITLTLPAASSATGKVFVLRNIGPNSITTTGTIIFGGTSSSTIAGHQGRTVQSNGSFWYQIQ